MNEVKEKDNKETIKEETKVSESDTEESTAQERKEENNTVEKAVEAPPLGAILDKRTEGMVILGQEKEIEIRKDFRKEGTDHRKHIYNSYNLRKGRKAPDRTGSTGT